MILIPPKTKFTKEAIIDAAFDIAKTEGIDSITVRKVADKLGSSIAPIYVNFTEVEELKQAILVKVHDIAQQYLMTPYSLNPFLNIGIASLKFAREYSVLFKDLIFNSSHYLNKVNPSSTNIMEQMKQSSTLSDFSDEELGEILFKMQVFQLGLSVMDVNGMLPEHFDEETIIRILDSAGKDVITAARLRKVDKE
ncbi:TetR/AcrR family transcriptional regulator [Bacillus sp. CGMCC 1.16607]|uniref:TetR/AcrR family transcriptional regulator n=1 Tax=Bacillus sp. CGMCC 1.16607 TaxID=3351842 RepID=UPI0036375446